MASISILFTKADQELVALGLNPRLVWLYGKLQSHINKHGDCQLTHQVLAEDIGITTNRQIQRMMRRLRRLGLVDWTRHRDSNRYTVFPPDITKIAANNRKGGRRGE